MPVTLAKIIEALPPEHRWTVADVEAGRAPHLVPSVAECFARIKQTQAILVAECFARIKQTQAILVAESFESIKQTEAILVAECSARIKQTQAILVAESFARIKQTQAIDVVAIAGGDRVAARPYVAHARRVWAEWRRQGVALFDTDAPDGSVANELQRRAIWEGVEQLLTAEAARLGRSKQSVLNDFLTAETIAICGEWLADLDALPLGALRVLPELAVEGVARSLASQPYTPGNLIIECRPAQPVAVPRGPGRPRMYGWATARLMLAAIFERSEHPDRLTLDDAADIFEELCGQQRPVIVNGAPVPLPPPYASEYDVIITPELRAKMRDRLRHIITIAGFAGWRDVRDFVLAGNSLAK